MSNESLHAPPRTALLIDGDNISAGFADEIRKACKTPAVARVYGDASSGSGWHRVAWAEFIHAGKAKNAADILLALDAMELAALHGYTHFVIVSSDGDFTHVARRLRGRGCSVSGLGEHKATETFQFACTTFQVLSGSADRVQTTEQSIDQTIRQIIKAGSQEGKGISISSLGKQMAEETGITRKDLPEKSWSAYLTARPARFAVDNPGPQAMVRFLPEGFK